MKRIYASLGMAALGVASIQSLQGQSVDASKSWSVSASLRGFYDDNVNTTPSKAGNKTESFGLEVSPTLSYNAQPSETTYVSAGYTYAYKWYDKRINYRDGHDTHTHTFAAQLRHSFSERFTASVQDSFALGQEPDVLRVGNGADSTIQHISGDNIRNYGSVNLDAQVTPEFGVEVGYANTLFSYDDNTPIYGYAALLDRIEHLVHIDGRWNIQRQTVGIIGYAFSMVDYTGDLPIGVVPSLPPIVYYSDSRNNRSHYAYVGVEHTFRPDLFGSIRGGARFNDYYNSYDTGSSVSPYVQGSLNYKYAPESQVELGVSHDRSATDLVSPTATGFTRDSDATVVYLSLKHRIVPNLFGSVVGSFQYSTFNGGALDQKAEQFYIAGVNLEYRFNRHVSAHIGYNYDRLESDANSVYAYGRSFDRNRVYVGATFAY